VANKSIAIDRSIAEGQLVDRARFCIELAIYLRRTLFNQHSRKHKHYPSIGWSRIFLGASCDGCP